MITAILQILFLLAVSCLIGVFFTYRIWKAKYKQLEDEKTELHRKLDAANLELGLVKAKNADLIGEISKLKEKPAAKKLEKKAEPDPVNHLADMELMLEQLEEKEREIEALSKELDVRKISYYKQIDGKRYKAITIKMADESVAGQGDGRISKEDAEKIFATISDGKLYTQVEKDTMRYLRDTYNWTEGADHLFRTKVRSWAAKGHNLD